MVDISIEILASSIPALNASCPRYRIKTWWAHIDVPPDTMFIRLPRLPMIQPYLIMTGKDTTVFVETWEESAGRNSSSSKEHGESVSNNSHTKFLGMTTCSVDDQLKNTNLNPSVQWLDVHNPVENVTKGKLLLKIDAKFAFPDQNHSNNNNEGEDPVKIRGGSDHGGSNFPPGFFDFSPTKHSIVSRLSRKSDTSVFSTGSVSSTRSQEQGCQTDLSLPQLPDISKFTAAAAGRSQSISDEKSKIGLERQHQQMRRQNSKSETRSRSPTSSTIVDPLKFAEELLLRGFTANKHDRKNSDPVGSSSKEFRRTCLVKQHLQQNQLPCKSTPPHANGSRSSVPAINKPPLRKFNMDDVEDVIDLLNDDADSVFSSPEAAADRQFGRERRGSKESKSGPSRPPPLSPYSRQESSSSNNGRSTTMDVQIKRLAPEGSSNVLEREKVSSSNPTSFSSQNQNMQQLQNCSSTKYSYGADDEDIHQQNQNRFREVHFDGNQAIQQASVMIKAKTTQPMTQSVSHPPVMRRRIAAAIFND